MSAVNRHATAVILGDRGILIMGPSGSGKTALALTLIRQAIAQRRFARLVADDQAFLSVAAGRLLARAPATIAGLAEVRGLGPTSVTSEATAVIDLAVMLEAADNAPRMREPQRFEYDGIGVERLALPARSAIQSALAIAAWLGWQPFQPS